GGTHKWLMSLQGLSYFYISENLSQRITQKFVGWTSVKDAWKLLDYELNFLENANKFQNGNSSRIGMIALDASLSLFEEMGYANIERQILDNSSYLINNLSEIGITPILENVNKNNIAGIVSFKNQNAEKIVKELKDKDISCTVREGMVRISPHFYNTKDDLDLLVDELVSLRVNK
ncbi:MAG: aminotransferase class V-fold PLP-dependent enzyme, partial [Ignavibacteriae bacterium]|nr:aminotransferase class V-fold PLP-dependent enzyme [Ignavibacteriota bacterium]